MYQRAVRALNGDVGHRIDVEALLLGVKSVSVDGDGDGDG
jgi:hypothetical protein